jgi:hypothetical protein
VNPVTVHRQQPPGAPITSIHVAAFTQLRDAVLRQLSATALAGNPPRKPDAINAVQ